MQEDPEGWKEEWEEGGIAQLGTWECWVPVPWLSACSPPLSSLRCFLLRIHGWAAECMFKQVFIKTSKIKSWRSWKSLRAHNHSSSLFPSPGTVFSNGKTSDYLLLGNTVYTVSLTTTIRCTISYLCWLLKRCDFIIIYNCLQRRLDSLQCLKKRHLNDSLRSLKVHFAF